MAENATAVLHAPRNIQLEQRPIPKPGPCEALVAIRSVGVCGSDVHYYLHGRIGNFVVEAPLVLGHECSGVIVAHGSQAGKQPVGTRVAVEPGIPCGRCATCRRGDYNLCPHVRFLATPPVDGAFTHYLAVHEDFLHPVPDTLSDVGAALVEPTSVAIWATRKARVQPGDRVLVTGAGPIGLLCAAVAAASGATEIVVTDINEGRLRHATKFGATSSILDGTADLAELSVQPNVLIECSGAESATRAGIGALSPRGRAVLVGMGANADLSLPVATIQTHELEVTGTFRYANAYPAAIALITKGVFDPTALVGAVFNLDEVEQALNASRLDPTILKAVVGIS